MHYYLAAAILLTVSLLAGALSSAQGSSLRGKFASFLLASLSLFAGLLLSVLVVMIIADGGSPQVTSGKSIVMIVCAVIPGCLGVLFGHARAKRSAP